MSSPDQTDHGLPIAGLGDRVAARAIDLVIVTSVWVAAAAAGTIALVVAGLAAVAWEALWLSTRGATPGKLVMGTRVVGTDGAPLDLARALLRSLDIIVLTAISFGSLGASAYGRLYYLTSLVVLTVDTDLRRSIMDHVAKTRVVSV